MLDESIEKINNYAKDKAYLILYYESDVKFIYERMYLRLKENRQSKSGNIMDGNSCEKVMQIQRLDITNLAHNIFFSF